MKKYQNLITIFLILLIGLFIFAGADCTNDGLMKQILGKNPSELNKDDVPKAINNFVNILAAIASTVTLMFMVWGGIQYITSAGNQEQAGKAKSTLTWAIIGFIVIIASYSIVKIFLSKITG